MAVGKLLENLGRFSRGLRALGFGLLLLVALGALGHEVIQRGRPSPGTAALAAVLALIVWWDVRSLLARRDAQRLTHRIAHARQTLASLDADSRIAHLRRLKRRAIIAGVSLLASVGTLLVCGDNQRVVAWVLLWVALSAWFTFACSAGLLLARRWCNQVQPPR